MKLSLRIRDWDKHFENNRSRELKKIDWVPVPNRMDKESYLEFVDHPNGAAHLGAWLAIVEIASSQSKRGTLPQGSKGIPHSLAVISRLPAGLFKEVIPRLLEIGWVEEYQQDTGSTAGIPQEGAGIPQEGAVRMRALREGKGIEEKRRAHTPCAPSRNEKDPDPDPEKFSAWAEEIYALHPKKKNKFLAMQKLASRFAHDERARAIFETNHELFRQSKSWLEQGGRFVPALCNPDDSGFISDEAWRYPPPDEEEDELMRWARDRDAARERGEIVN